MKTNILVSISTWEYMLCVFWTWFISPNMMPSNGSELQDFNSFLNFNDVALFAQQGVDAFLLPTPALLYHILWVQTAMLGKKLTQNTEGIQIEILPSTHPSVYRDLVGSLCQLLWILVEKYELSSELCLQILWTYAQQQAIRWISYFFFLWPNNEL